MTNTFLTQQHGCMWGLKVKLRYLGQQDKDLIYKTQQKNDGILLDSMQQPNNVPTSAGRLWEKRVSQYELFYITKYIFSYFLKKKRQNVITYFSLNLFFK